MDTNLHNDSLTLYASLSVQRYSCMNVLSAFIRVNPRLTD